MQKITPFLWFKDSAEEAAKFYTGMFKDSRIGEVMRYGDAGPGPKGAAMSVTFQLEGQGFIALNGNPAFEFSPALSLFVKCDTQQEIDGYWDKFLDGGQPMQCGWIKDRFGVTWQVVPNVLGKMLQDKDPARAKRVMEAMMQMVKLDIQTLEDAYAQG